MQVCWPSGPLHIGEEKEEEKEDTALSKASKKSPEIWWCLGSKKESHPARNMDNARNKGIKIL